MSHAIPVIMYHSVGRPIPGWPWAKKLTIPWSVFEDHLIWLAKSGYETVGLDELHAHVSGESPLPEHSVVLTFDDGYGDNWVYAAPLLAKYKFTGTIAVTTDFVDRAGQVRPNLDDVRAGKKREELVDVRGFVSWLELKTALDSGVLSAQSHAATHTKYPSGPEVIDFHHPGDDHYWIDWNLAPRDKPDYLKTLDDDRGTWGTPVYVHNHALATTRYFPDPDEADHLSHYVAKHGGRAFFERAGWRDALFRELKGVRGKGDEPGRYESDVERRERYLNELAGSKRTLEEKLGATVDFLVWPSHAYNEESMTYARDIYKATTVDVAKVGGVKNRVGEDPAQIVRMGVPLIKKGDGYLYPGGRYLTKYLDEFRGHALGKRQRQILKRIYKIGFRGTK